MTDSKSSDNAPRRVHPVNGQDRFLVETRLGSLLLLAVTILGALLRFWHLDWHLPSTLHPDEHNIVLRALRFGTGDLNPHYFLYGSLLMYLSFLGYGLHFAVGYLTGVFQSPESFAVSYFLDPTPFYLISRSISAVCGALSIPATYLIASRLHSTSAGLMAAVAMALYAEHVIQSRYALPASLAVVLLSVVYWLTFSSKAEARLSKGRLFSIGLVGGLSVSAHMLASFGCLIAGGYLVVENRHSLRRLGWVLVLGTAGGLLGLFLGEPFLFLDFRTAVSEVSGFAVVDHPTSPLRVLAAILIDFWRNIGPIAALAAVAGIVFLLQRRDPALTFVIGATGAFVLYLSHRGFAPPRFLLMVLPLLCALAGVGAADLLARVPMASHKLQKTVTLAVILALFAPPAVKSYEAVRVFGLPDTRVLARRWIHQAIAPDSRIILVGPEANVPRLMENSVRAEELREVSASQGTAGSAYEGLGNYYRFKAIAAEVTEEPTYWLVRIKPAWWAEREEEGELVSRYGIVPRNVPPTTKLLPRTLDFYRIALGIEYVVVTDRALRSFDNDRFPTVQRFFADLRDSGQLVHIERPGENVSGPVVFIWDISGYDPASEASSD